MTRLADLVAIYLVIAALVIGLILMANSHPAPQPVWHQAPCLTAPDGYPLSAWETAPHGTLCPRTWQAI